MKLVLLHLLNLHPQADLVPRMSESQSSDFESDIQRRGIRVPIEVIDGNIIIDGRSRFLAARKLGIIQVPIVKAPIQPNEDPVLYMLRAASKRRHLTEDQLACLALEEMKILSIISLKQRAAKGGRGNRHNANEMNLAVTSTAKSRDRSLDIRAQLSTTYGVSEHKIRSAKRLSEISPALFEQAKSGRTRIAEAKREAQRQKRKRELADQMRNVRVLEPQEHWRIQLGDCLAELKKIEPGSIRLIFADPPYNIGVDYGNGPIADTLPRDEYMAWCQKWVDACIPLLTSDGSMWVMINDEHADSLGVMLRETGMPRRVWIKWYETFGVNCENNFNRCSRHIFYHVKDPKQFVFNREAIIQPSERLKRYQDQRAALGGKLWDNVWCIPRLVENSSERIPGLPTQLPLDLVQPIVECASDPGDLVLDPFSGSGTTGVAAIKTHRRYIGIEKNPEFHKLSMQRLSIATNRVSLQSLV